MKRVVIENKLEKYKPRPMECFICEDSGLVIFQKEYNGMLYDVATRCVCEKGKKFNGCIERIDKLFNVVDIENENRKKFNKPLKESSHIQGFIEV